MNPLFIQLNENEKMKKIINNVLDGNTTSNISVVGLDMSAKAYSIVGITNETKKNAVIVCSNVTQATKLIQDLKFFTDIEIIYFPAKPIQYYDLEAESKEIENQRMYAISKISEAIENRSINKNGNVFEDKLNIIVTTIDALITKIPKIKSNKELEFKISIDKDFKLDNLMQTLVEFGYERADVVEGKGQFSVRGGIVDLFTVDSELPYRIEFFGDTVDSIRTFDVLTQRSIDTLKNINISCVLENYISDNKLNDVISKLEKLCEGDKINSDLKQVIYEDIEKMRNKTVNINKFFDRYFNLFENDSVNFLDYLKDYTVFFDEPKKCIEKTENLYYENLETIKILEKRNYIYSKYVNKYIDFEELSLSVKNKNNIYLESIELDYKIHVKRDKFEIPTKENHFYKSKLDILLLDLQKAKDKKILLVFPTKIRLEQIKNYLIDNNIKASYVENISSLKSLNKGEVYITQGTLSSGFEANEFNLLIISEPVSGTKFSKIQKSRKNSDIGSAINSYEDLAEGDYVVHENQGVGIYRGIDTIEIGSVIKDYIKIEYDKNSMLYVPITQLDSVKKFICDDEAKPKINTLGTGQWQKIKNSVKKHVKEIAKELITLYAKRENMKGFAFEKDTLWQKEFEDSFEYELTDDQDLSIQEIKKDMEEQMPMDRLLCGDVGYGKTEVALRVAFKAVVNSKQVAYLVPTTVLSLQQYNTFKARMEPFGIRVEMLSRFKTKKEQTQILKDLVDGKVDVVVGTHRLLSKDVFFKDLGLLVIDEEHRFGVKAKENIKQIKETVDVLSMTATPIPRTLHMSMIGVRSMSTLMEPPMERLPVHTYVLEYDENIIKDAIEKELLRDGQVFYINNRVNNIEEITMKIKELVPHARVAFAHGQMNPHEIEKIMLEFIEHKLDVLVCTTILESGIDIPNANTIIVENADRLGLAQLYQIRGRVGRSSRIAYAYITYKKNKQISEISEKRLKAIRDFTEFGSGFKIALRDLEIRGAGNLLGQEQHGHMQKVGYDLYLALLEKAIKEQKNGKESQEDDKEQVEKDVKIDLNISAYIHDDYIKNPLQKIAMYQKISDIITKEESLEVIDELLDRYGEIPKEVENLVQIVEIRNLARKIGITRVFEKDGFLIFEPSNLKYRLTNFKNNDILINVHIEMKKLEKLLEKRGIINE